MGNKSSRTIQKTSGTRRVMVCLILQVLDARLFLSRSSGLVFAYNILAVGLGIYLFV
ncbi:hypothetical protein RchiOBHm_Chr1g0356721 [Rosa chinensis]|uniref:Uncharacterized protein n=1 Tax=Rosa chinensis TaxID=74649 RepID=A0A2P6SHQ4_ROSCH|nr:hypothetical protein RchiOBHm_Chr1g0356721 [Rosa chinensis]